MKLIKLNFVNEPSALALISIYERTEAVSQSLFEAVAKLHAIRSVLNDTQYWARFPLPKADGMAVEAAPSKLKVLAAWQSAKLAYLQRHAAARKLAEEMLYGPIAEVKAYLAKTTDHSSETFLRRANNVVAAEQLANRVLGETTKVGELIRHSSCSEEAALALEELFESSFSGCNSGGWKREETLQETGSHLGPAISDDMLYLQADSDNHQTADTDSSEASIGYPDYLNAQALLMQAQTALQDLRSYKGHLNEESFGQRLQKVLKKPAELEAVVAEQHMRRCHLASLLANLHAAKRQIDFKVMDSLGHLINTLVYDAQTTHDRQRRFVSMNNALVLVQICRKLDKCAAHVEAELTGNADLYNIASEALLSVVRGEEPAPKLSA